MSHFARGLRVAGILFRAISRVPAPMNEAASPGAAPGLAASRYGARSLQTFRNSSSILLAALVGCGRPATPHAVAQVVLPPAPSGAARPAPPPSATIPGRCPAETQFIPDGTYTVGQSCGNGCTPRGDYSINALCMDTVAVTSRAFLKCITDDVCHWSATSSPEGSRECLAILRFQAPERAANCITHDELDEFCHSRGGRIPTDVEWEVALQGTSSHPDGSRNTDNGGRVQPNYDVSPFGVQGMFTAGREWTSTLADGLGDAEAKRLLSEPGVQGPLYWTKGVRVLSVTVSIRYAAARTYRFGASGRCVFSAK